MFGFKLLGKTHIPHRKNTAACEAVRMNAPAEVLLPMLQHIGAPANPVVKVGDEVKVGQLIAEANGCVSSPIYASVSGKVTKIESYLCPNGRTVDAIRIASDGEMNTYEGITAPAVTDFDSFIEAVRNSGVVGLGGAGFPTSVKLDAIKKGGIDTIIINGAECEPYITGDTLAMIYEAEWLKIAIDTLREQCAPFGQVDFVFGVENNKPEAIKALSELFADADDVSVCVLPSLYPQGAEKVMIHNTIGRIVPEGKLPTDVGAIVINVSSLVHLAKYLKTGMPLVDRVVTLDGSAVGTPMNIIAPVGASVQSIIDFSGGLKEEAGKILFGGPMMGIPVCSFDEPTTKLTGAITVMNVKDSIEPEATACIHCGKCVSVCPTKLNPTAFSGAMNIASEEERIAVFNKEHIKLCIECGCCSFVCPAKRPLVQNNRLAKAETKAYEARMAELKN